MKITAQLLKSNGVCARVVNKFAGRFPDGVLVTESLCVQQGRDWNWDEGARRLLRPSARDKYARARDTALRAHNRAIAPNRGKYDRAIAAALVEFERDADQFAYNRAIAPMRVAYNHACAEAQAKFELALASAFGLLAEAEAAEASAQAAER